MSKVIAINTIIETKNFLKRYEKAGICFIHSNDILMWLDNIHLELADK